jgi:hypothetical protein
VSSAQRIEWSRIVKELFVQALRFSNPAIKPLIILAMTSI